jgi:DNA-binding NtrC family response regulator
VDNLPPSGQNCSADMVSWRPLIVSNCEQNQEAYAYIHRSMIANATVLFIHRDPRQLTLLNENGYGVVTASNGCEGLRLLMTQAVDAVVLEYYLGLLDGAIVADEIKHVRPHVPVVMVADPRELPDGALRSVDTLVDKTDGPHLVWAALHFLLTTRAQQDRSMVEARTTQEDRFGRTRTRKRAIRSSHLAAVPGSQARPFSAALWKDILDGTVQF